MVEIFITWNQNYDKFIDFLADQLRGGSNSEIKVHVFVPSNVAEKYQPRSLPWMVRHDCHTNTNDSAGAHLITYVMRHYTTGAENPDQEENLGRRKLVLFAQTKPGQHEELVMLLSKMKEFTSKFDAKIYQIDDCFRSRRDTSDKNRNQQIEIERSWYQNSSMTVGEENAPNTKGGTKTKRKIEHFRNASYPYSHWGDDSGRETNNFHCKQLHLNWYEGNDGVREMNNIRKKHEENEIGVETCSLKRSIKDFERNSEQGSLCEKCENALSDFGGEEVPLTRRTWPNSRNGCYKQKEKFNQMGRICMHRCFCCFSGREEAMQKRDHAESPFQNSDDIRVDRKRTARNSSIKEEILFNDAKSSPNLSSYVLWSVDKNSQCKCSDMRVCGRCFITEILRKASEKNDLRGSDNAKLTGGDRSSRKRPDSSPAVLHGTEGQRNTVIRQKGENAEKDRKKLHANGTEGQGSRKEAPAQELQHVIIADNENSVTKESDVLPEAVKYVVGPGTASVEQVISHDPQGNSAKEKEIRGTQSTPEHGQKQEDLQGRLEELLARLAKENPEVQNGDGDDIGEMKEVPEINEDKESNHDIDEGKQERTEGKKGTLQVALSDGNLCKDGNENHSGNEEQCDSTSRIHSGSFDHKKIDSMNSVDFIANITKEYEARLLKQSQKDSNEFDYDLFDSLDIDAERNTNETTKERRGKSQSKRDTIPMKNGRYVCHFCPERKFASVHVWKIHMKNTHKKCNCPCGEYFMTREDYLVHFYGLFPLPCLLERKCPERFRSLYFQALHHREKHLSDRPFFCVLCFEAEQDPKMKRKVCFKDIKSLRIHAESMEHDPNKMFLISSQSDADENTLPWSMKCSGIDFC